MGIRTFFVGVAFGAGGFWAVDQGYHLCAIDFIKEKIGMEDAQEVEAAPVMDAEPAEAMDAEPASAPEELEEAAEPEEAEEEAAPAAEPAGEEEPVAVEPPAEDVVSSFTGEASYYAESLNGNPTASGELYDHSALTAAHLTLDFGTMARVTNLETAANVVVRINDRGPYAGGRVIDVSGEAARQLGMIEAGIVEVRVDVLSS